MWSILPISELGVLVSAGDESGLKIWGLKNYNLLADVFKEELSEMRADLVYSNKEKLMLVGAGDRLYRVDFIGRKIV